MGDFNQFKTASVESQEAYGVLISPHEDQSEQRRILSERRIESWQCSFPPMTLAQFQSLRNFYQSKLGPLATFTYTCPFTGATRNVRFEGALNRSFQAGHYRASCTLVAVDNEEVT